MKEASVDAPCVICQFPFPQGELVHQTTHVHYACCRACANKGYFNGGIFQYVEADQPEEERD